MAVFKQLKPAEIAGNFTHHGILCGVVPVYVHASNPDAPIVARNWVPEWAIPAVLGLWNVIAALGEGFNPDFEAPPFPIRLTARIAPVAA